MPYLCRHFTLLLQITCLIQISQGSPLEITSISHSDVFVGPDIGVYIDSCSAITFQVKSCNAAHVWLGDGTAEESYEIVIGGSNNVECVFRNCDTCFSSVQTFPAPDVLDCAAFRYFWVSWGDGRVALGRGRVPHEDVIFDIPDPNLHNINTISLVGFNTAPATFILGETGKSRFEKSLVEGKYLADVILEDTMSWVNCSQQCHGHPSCGMFSYNDDLARCVLFDRMTSSFLMTLQAGWKSWRMKYCQ